MCRSVLNGGVTILQPFAFRASALCWFIINARQLWSMQSIAVYVAITVVLWRTVICLRWVKASYSFFLAARSLASKRSELFLPSLLNRPLRLALINHGTSCTRTCHCMWAVLCCALRIAIGALYHAMGPPVENLYCCKQGFTVYIGQCQKNVDECRCMIADRAACPTRPWCHSSVYCVCMYLRSCRCKRLPQGVLMIYFCGKFWDCGLSY